MTSMNNQVRGKVDSTWQSERRIAIDMASNVNDGKAAPAEIEVTNTHPRVGHSASISKLDRVLKRRGLRITFKLVHHVAGSHVFQIYQVSRYLGQARTCQSGRGYATLSLLTNA